MGRAAFSLLFLLMGLSSPPDFDALRWHKRVILLFAAEENDGQLQQQKHMLESNLGAMEERDIQIFEFVGLSAEDQKIRTRFGVNGKGFAIVLVGKDGSRKLESGKPVTPEHLFGLIDSMPMRQDEMQKKKS